MAISTRNYTALSLDRYARIMGINPMHFNTGGEVHLTNGGVLFPINNNVENIWPQFAWQNSDQVSIDDLAEIIREVEFEIEQVLGWNVIPRFTEKEEHIINREYGRVEINRQKFISGGKRKVSLLCNATISYDDVDGDGYDEVGKINKAINAAYDPTTLDTENIKFYIAGKGGAINYEIRNAKTCSIVGSNIVAEFDTWLLIDPVVREVLPTNDNLGKFVDTTDSDTLVTSLDVYYETIDTTENHIELCSYNPNGTERLDYSGYLRKTETDGVLEYQPATYDSTTQTWNDVTCLNTSCGTNPPKIVNLYYQSGNSISKTFRYNVADKLDSNIAKAIAYMATARLPRVYYSNNNTTSIATDLMADWANRDDRKQMLDFKMLSNPFGTKGGEVKAWMTISKLLKNVIKYSII